MFDRNAVEIIGTVAGEPKFRKTPATNRSMATMLVKVHRFPTGTSMENVMVQAWEELADAIHANYHDGSRVQLKGRIANSSYLEGDKRRYFTRVIADEIEEPDDDAAPEGFGCVSYSVGEN